MNCRVSSRRQKVEGGRQWEVGSSGDPGSSKESRVGVGKYSVRGERETKLFLH